jgi:hypothetical protein
LILTLIASFTRIDDPIATPEVNHACTPLWRTGVVRLDLARAAATITRKGVAIIALFTRLIDSPITATRRGSSLPARPARSASDGAAPGPNLEAATGTNNRTGSPESGAANAGGLLVFEFRSSAATRRQSERTH